MAGLGALVPLIVLFIIVGIAAFIGYGLYQWSNELADKASKKLEAKNVSFSKDGGLRVGVKDLREESYADKTQNVLVNVWNNASFPNYTSHLGWNKAQAKAKTGQPRASTSRTNSSGPAPAPASVPSTAGARSSVRASPALQGQAVPVQRKSGPNVPGGW